MSITLGIQELSRFRVSAEFASSDGRISLSLSLRPAQGSEINLGQTSAGLLIHFETAMEHGCSKLHVYTSYQAEEKRCASSTTTAADISDVQNDDLTTDTASSHSHLTDSFPMVFPQRPNPGTSSWEVSDILEAALAQNAPNYSALPADFGMFTCPSEESGPPYVTPTPNDCDLSFLMKPSAPVSFEDDHLLSVRLPQPTFSLPGFGLPVGSPGPTSESSSLSVDTSSHARVQRPRRLNCLHPDCKRRFMSEYTRRLHMRTHEPKARYPCEMGCSETFSRQHDRLRHEVAKHGRSCEWLCNRCRRFFSCQASRDGHQCPSRH